MESAEDKKPEEIVPLTLEILPMIKEVQQQHGLRHGDYQRYRQYCARRLRRLYKVLHFTQGTRNSVKPKRVGEDKLTDVRYLHVVLINAERAWSYAMELKLLANTEPRKRFHMLRRLGKATQHAKELKKLSESERCDPRTKLEAQAYCCYMLGTLKFEMQQWKEALELFGEARTIYEKLGSAFSEEQQNFYQQKADEISPNIRYCAYNLDDGNVDINELMKMRFTPGSGAQDLLADKLDMVISQTREKQASSLTEITWKGKSVPVKNEQVRSFILHSNESQQEVERAGDFENKMAVYDQLLMECKDGLQSLKDEMKPDQGKSKAPKTEAHLANLEFLHSYLVYIRLTKTVERNLLMVDSLKSNFPRVLLQSNYTDGSQSGTGSSSKKITKPEDLVRIYDIILQNLTDIEDLLEDDESTLSQRIASQKSLFKAHRCLYIAHSYLVSKKWKEATALYERVLKYAEEASSLYGKLPNEQERISEIGELTAQAQGHMYAAHASYLLDIDDTDEKMKGLTIHDTPLQERLDVYDDKPINMKKPNITHFPPNFEPIPCKPLFFDLASNQMQFPSLSHRMEQKKTSAGITNYIKGWFWGGSS
ncbi:signal recognition particle subunit SRP68-like [Dendronephthya gigantea]|uniref:signal recognition particle subunit SRP68-like n=1 Tax=Dendronephthya gigantea TaxID=151771 RepID=UPI001069A6E0|nr:signal recognition particle subunit SRP68-like [Dendronephthya gigantea]